MNVRDSLRCLSSSEMLYKGRKENSFGGVEMRKTFALDFSISIEKWNLFLDYEDKEMFAFPFIAS